MYVYICVIVRPQPRVLSALYECIYINQPPSRGWVSRGLGEQGAPGAHLAPCSPIPIPLLTLSLAQSCSTLNHVGYIRTLFSVLVEFLTVWTPHMYKQRPAHYTCIYKICLKSILGFRTILCTWVVHIHVMRMHGYMYIIIHSHILAKYRGTP